MPCETGTPIIGTTAMMMGQPFGSTANRHLGCMPFPDAQKILADMSLLTSADDEQQETVRVALEEIKEKVAAAPKAKSPKPAAKAKAVAAPTADADGEETVASPASAGKKKRVVEGKEEKGDAKKAKKEKDTNAPKKPMSSYFLYTVDQRPLMKAAHPEYSVTDMSKALGAAWKEVDAETKAKYAQLQIEAKETYTKQLADYTATGAFEGQDAQLAKLAAEQAKKQAAADKAKADRAAAKDVKEAKKKEEEAAAAPAAVEEVEEEAAEPAAEEVEEAAPAAAAVAEDAAMEVEADAGAAGEEEQ
jgi:uncharacterized protein (DUF736 family)